MVACLATRKPHPGRWKNKDRSRLLGERSACAISQPSSYENLDKRIQGYARILTFYLDEENDKVAAAKLPLAGSTACAGQPANGKKASGPMQAAVRDVFACVRACEKERPKDAAQKS